MRQFCGSIDECCFGVDFICVYCERKMPPYRRSKKEEENKKPLIKENELDEKTDLRFRDEVPG